ncbi:hypothetical protein McanMca71_007218 [Microsporum canis]|uniref:Helicase ATP-binding domain-containing protein n=1 Tax=Arthroderma otae (strain ATCC MYA-4605 / CBS 113480) TaxID=554155 RepID=C5FMT8_ARTOC|nr:conserved hypothetical protein [Microsporum canis CBS 113480]EEQ31909.1 conserved hypothetical protein [Microsporum canis CBS 113480]
MNTSTGTYQSLEKLSTFLGFDTIPALQKWMGSMLCKPYWDEYHGWAASEIADGRIPKLTDYRSVLKHLTEGEAVGIRKFSTDFPDISAWTAIDWHARLLYKILSVNQADRHGIFYGKNFSEVEMASRAWQVILRLKLDASHEHRPRKKAKATSEFEHWRIDDDEAIPTPVNPERGAASVIWMNIPADLEEQGIKSMVVLKGLVSYTYERFLEEIYRGLELKEHGLQIDKLSVDGDTISGSSFKEFLGLACCSAGRLLVALNTEKGLPEPDIPQIENEELSRRLLYDLMVAERVSSEFDLRDRFWIWTAIQKASKVQHSPINSNCVLLHEAVDIEGDSIRWLMKSKDSDDPESGTKDVLRELTDSDIKQYREQEKWIDNQDLQRQGHGEACSALGIPNPDIPRLPGMPVSAKFEFWQPLAVKALKEFEEGYLRGGILADEVGIGKTFEAIGLEQHHWNLRKAALESNMQIAPPRPTLIVVPPNLIQQWASTIRAMSMDLIVKIYYGGRGQNQGQSGADGVEYLRGVLSRDDKVFSKTEETARTAIITSFRTLTTRHGPTSLRKWLRNKISSEDGSENYASVTESVHSIMERLTRPPDEWPHGLSGCFKRVIVDEAHEIRNKKSLTATTLHWLQSPAVLLLSATPIWNGLSDILGLLYQLEPVENPWSKKSLNELGAFDIEPLKNSESSIQYECDTNDGNDSIDEEAENLTYFLKRIDPWEIPCHHPASSLRYTSESVKHHIINGGGNDPLTKKGKRMREVLKACMIKRSYGSLVDGQVVGQALPAVQNISVHLEFTQEEQREYERTLDHCLATIRRKKAKENEEEDKNKDAADILSGPKFRRLCLVTSWTDFDFVGQSYTAKNLTERRKKGVLPALTILKDVNNGKQQLLRRQNLLQEEFPQIMIHPLPSPDDIKGILQAHCRGSPKLRYLLQLVAELVVLRKEKMLIFATLPTQVHWLESVLKLLELDANSYRAELNIEDRQILADTFHRSPTKCQILITSFWVCCTGLNLHGHCRNLVFWDAAPISAEQQALGRLKRVGATRTIRLFRLFIDKTFSTEQNMKYIAQAIPGLMAQLNMEVFGEEDGTDGAVLGQWVIHEGQLVKADDPSVLGLGLPALGDGDLLTHILMIQQGKEI